jgi:hypothetical protein
MKKIFNILFLILISVSCFAGKMSYGDSLIMVSRETASREADSVVKADMKAKSDSADIAFEKQFKKDIAVQKEKADGVLTTTKECFSILKDEVKEYGIIKTIRANGALFIPLFIFLVLTLIWFKGKKKV